jgi:hypothetical protein
LGASPLSPVPITLYRSEYIKQDLNPKWQPFYLSTDMIGDHDTPFVVNVYDYDSDVRIYSVIAVVLWHGF